MFASNQTSPDRSVAAFSVILARKRAGSGPEIGPFLRLADKQLLSGFVSKSATYWLPPKIANRPQQLRWLANSKILSVPPGRTKEVPLRSAQQLHSLV